MNFPATTAAACGGCNSHRRWLLHHVRLRGTHRRLCTSCVLLHHRSSFCPSCLHLHDGAAAGAPARLVACEKCPAAAHPQCAAAGAATYLCPPCADPKFSFFDPPDSDRTLDRNLATVLLCAARIASSSMSNAAVAARAEAVRRASEASSARKRAREALDMLARVVAMEKARRKEGSGDVSAGLRRSHSQGFDRFLAENADPCPSGPSASNEKERFGNVGSKVDSDNVVQKTPLHDIKSNGNVEKSSV